MALVVFITFELMPSVSNNDRPLYQKLSFASTYWILTAELPSRAYQGSLKSWPVNYRGILLHNTEHAVPNNYLTAPLLADWHFGVPAVSKIIADCGVYQVQSAPH
jgi:hypothetical protein